MRPRRFAGRSGPTTLWLAGWGLRAQAWRPVLACWPRAWRANARLAAVPVPRGLAAFGVTDGAPEAPRRRRLRQRWFAAWLGRAGIDAAGQRRRWGNSGLASHPASAPYPDVIVGWSLGGLVASYIATAIAAARRPAPGPSRRDRRRVGPGRGPAVIVVATAPAFLARDGGVVATADWARFRRATERPERLAVAFARLACTAIDTDSASAERTDVERWLDVWRRPRTATARRRLRVGLDLLAGLPCAAVDAALRFESDALVAPSRPSVVAAGAPGAECREWHLPGHHDAPLAQPARVADAIRQIVRAVAMRPTRRRSA